MPASTVHAARRRRSHMSETDDAGRNGGRVTNAELDRAIGSIRELLSVRFDDVERQLERNHESSERLTDKVDRLQNEQHALGLTVTALNDLVHTERRAREKQRTEHDERLGVLEADAAARSKLDDRGEWWRRQWPSLLIGAAGVTVALIALLH